MGELEKKIYEKLLTTRDGRSSCPECDWWVPEGMEYLFLEPYTEHENLSERVREIREGIEN